MNGSPQIFEPECKSSEQIQFANPFCRFMSSRQQSLKLCFISRIKLVLIRSALVVVQCYLVRKY
jgi:hypothetical protein